MAIAVRTWLEGDISAGRSGASGTGPEWVINQGDMHERRSSHIVKRCRGNGTGNSYDVNETAVRARSHKSLLCTPNRYSTDSPTRRTCDDAHMMSHERPRGGTGPGRDLSFPPGIDSVIRYRPTLRCTVRYCHTYGSARFLLWSTGPTRLVVAHARSRRRGGGGKIESTGVRGHVTTRISRTPEREPNEPDPRCPVRPACAGNSRFI